MLKITLLFKKSTSRANNSRILRIKNPTFSGYCFYMNTNILPLFTRRSLGTNQFVCRDKRFLSCHVYFEKVANFSRVEQQIDRGKSIDYFQLELSNIPLKNIHSRLQGLKKGLGTVYQNLDDLSNLLINQT